MRERPDELTRGVSSETERSHRFRRSILDVGTFFGDGASSFPCAGGLLAKWLRWSRVCLEQSTARAGAELHNVGSENSLARRDPEKSSGPLFDSIMMSY
jgi:hypothetical protein